MKRPTEPPLDEVESYRMPLIEHLKELRNRLVISTVALVLGMVIALVFVQPVYGFLTAPVRLMLEDATPYPTMDDLYLQLTAPLRSVLPAELTDIRVKGTMAIQSPMEGVYTWLYTTVVGGALLAAPVIAFQIWQFVAPGLYKQERRYVLPLTAASTLLFLAGAAFAFLVLMPVAFPFFLQVLPADALLSVQAYLGTVVRLMLAFGVCFQLPIAIFFLARLGLIDHRDLVNFFRYSVVVIFIVSAILTPPDVFTQVLLGVPLILLYIASIGVAWLFTTKERVAGG